MNIIIMFNYRLFKFQLKPQWEAVSPCCHYTKIDILEENTTGIQALILWW